MTPPPRSVHVGAAAGDQKPAVALPRFFVSDVCELALMACVLILPWFFAFYDLPPQFSVQLAPVGGGGRRGASNATAFTVALHAGNRRATERCYRGGGEAVVTYAGFDVASGRVPGFCMPGKGSREVPFLARDGGASLPEHLRDRMAAARKVAGGGLELEVQVRLSQSGVSGKPTWMWCKARMGGAQPPEMTMCTVFALQHWFDFVA
ncbi:hypothetical protein ACP4OV_024096 [Aristida adscensionis]